MKINVRKGQGAARPVSGTKNIIQVSPEDISVIRFEGVTVRIISFHGAPWFVTKDVCVALEIANPSDAIKSLDDDEKNTLALTEGIRGNPNHGVIAESGFYKLVVRSRKATTQGTFAYRFTNWVFREVIPSIRKTGAYGVPWASLNDFTRRQQHYIAKSSQRGRDLQACKDEKSSLLAEEAGLWRQYQPALDFQ